MRGEPVSTEADRKPEGEGRGPFIHIFVYGTLRRGVAASPLMERCELVGPATVTGTLYDIDGEFPALVLAGNGRVHGEVWRCPADILPELDRYEGIDDRLFRRVALRAGGIACWTYVAGPALAARLQPDRRIPGGRWPPAEPPR